MPQIGRKTSEDFPASIGPKKIGGADLDCGRPGKKELNGILGRGDPTDADHWY